MYHLRRLGIVVVSIVLTYWALSGLRQYLDPNTHKTDEQREDARWIATSKSWLDRQACRWLGLCGIAHYHPDPAARLWKQKNERSQKVLADEEEEYADKIDWQDIIGGGKKRPGDWVGDGRVLKDVPDFVIDHAPLIHLYSKEQFWPSDFSDHLMHTAPYTNHTSLHLNNSRHTAFNLHEINELERGKYLFMHSKDDVEERPDWLSSAYNKPVPYGDENEEQKEKEEEEIEAYTEFQEVPVENFKNEAWYDPFGNKQAEPLEQTFRAQAAQRPAYSQRKRDKYKRTPALAAPGGYSPAPVVLVLIDKGHGILDAFWFYFYSYNLGTTVLTMRFGNHIGDWEHSLIRFQNGVPKAVFFSAHSGGLAYSYDAVEKGKGPGREGRPVLYSAYGSHAMYATPGTHPYVLPFGMLADVTDKGPLWDPSLNYLAYHYTTDLTHDLDAVSTPSSRIPSTPEEKEKQRMNDILQPASCNPKAPMSWWWYKGHWGDKFYELGDFRQWRFVGQYHYVNGPFGPRFKNLGRSKPCQSGVSCTILESIDAGKGKSWLGRRRRK